jgi:hypothetical protein
MDSLFSLVVGLGLLGLFWYGFARAVSSKREWEKEKSKNREMIFTGILFLFLAIVVVSLI